MFKFSSDQPILERAMDEHDASQFLGVSVKCLQGWRFKQTGPRFYRVSNRVRYLPSDLRDYLRSCVVEPAKQGGAQ